MTRTNSVTKTYTKFLNKSTSQNIYKKYCFFKSHETKQNNVWDGFSLANVNNHTPRVLGLLNDLSKMTVYKKNTCEFYNS